MISTKRISIIIPVYNSEKTLTKLLDCICSQSNEKDEIIIVDDDSIDESRVICRKFAKKYYNKIKYIENNRNYGPSFSRNIGIKAAQGEYICFVDSDDMLAPNALDTMFSFIKKECCEIVQGGYYFIYKNELLYKKKYTKLYSEGKVLTRDEAMHSLTANNFINNFVWGKLYKTEIVKKYRFKEDTLIGEDILWQHMVINEANRIGVISTPLYYYIQTSQGLSLKLSTHHIGILEGYQERLNFFKLYYPKLVNIHLKAFWLIAYKFYLFSQHSDLEIKNLFCQYFIKIGKENFKELEAALKNNPEYFLYNVSPNLLKVYNQISRIVNYIRSRIGFSEYEHLPYFEQ